MDFLVAVLYHKTGPCEEKFKRIEKCCETGAGAILEVEGMTSLYQEV